jgi:hypothetical protein
MRLSRVDVEVEESLEIHGIEEEIKEEELSELKKLAIDWVEGKVLFDVDLPPHAIPNSFMPLIFIEANKIPWDAHIYEYLDASRGGTSINGWPCFFSFKVVRKKRFRKVVDLAEEYLRVKEEFLSS